MFCYQGKLRNGAFDKKEKEREREKKLLNSMQKVKK
jgi:hypothetical protein